MGLLGKGKRDTNTIGNISEAAIIIQLLQLGYVVEIFFCYAREDEELRKGLEKQLRAL